MRIVRQALFTKNPPRNIRKNYGGMMIFGDEKHTPLRSGRLTCGYAASGSARPTSKLLPSVATSHTRQTLDDISLSKKISFSTFSAGVSNPP